MGVSSDPEINAIAAMCAAAMEHLPVADGETRARVVDYVESWWHAQQPKPTPVPGTTSDGGTEGTR